MKKFISVLMIVTVMLCACLPVAASAKAEKASLPESGQLDFSRSRMKEGSFKYEFRTIDHVEYCRKVYDDGYSTAYTVGVLFDTLEYAMTATEIKIVGQIDGIPVTEAGIELCKSDDDSPEYDCYNTKISDNVESIEKRYVCYNAYDGNNGATERKIGANVEKVTIPDSIKSIPAEAFSNMKKLKKLSLPKNLEKLGQGALMNCEALESVVFKGDKVTHILENTFKNCKALKTVRFNNSKIESIGKAAFYNCKALKRISLPASLESLGGSAFEKSGLEAVTIPKNASLPSNFDEDEMGSTFKNCKSLKTVTFLGKNVFIPSGMFWKCDSLKEINLKNAKKVSFSNYDYITVNAISTKKDVLKINAKNKSVAKELSGKLSKQGKISKCKKIRIYVGDDLKYNIPMEKHIYKAVKAKKATYFKDGHTAYKYCTKCGYKIGYKRIPKLVLNRPQITVTGKKSAVKVKYNPVKGATGFQLKYINSKGTTVIKSFKTLKAMTVTLKKLPAGSGKVCVRAFVVNGKQSAFSKWRVKTVTVR